MNRRRELAALLAVAVLGVAVFGAFLAESPSAGVRLDRSQDGATAVAASFLEEQGYDVAAYRRSTIFAAREESATFIQRTLDGKREAAALSRANIYYWETRFYRPLEQETFRVAVDARTGEVVRFSHQVPDEAPGGALSRDAARERAREFLRARGHDLGEYELVSESTTERRNRVDHRFVWRHTNRRIAGAPYRIEVEIHGERIGGYDPHVSVPDGFTHQYQVQQNRGRLLTFAFLGLSFVLVVAAIGFGLRYYKAGEFDTRYALAVGVPVALLSVLGTVNAIPRLLHSVPTTVSPAQFLLLSVGGAAFGGLLIGAVAALMAGVGKRLSTEVYGAAPVDRLRPVLEDAATRRAVAGDLLKGLPVAGVVLGVYGAFYLVGTRLFGFWLPAAPPQVGAVAVYVPALAALVAGGVAALWEEVTYRLFAIPLVERYLSVTALAVVVPAFVWGLGHSGYAVLPFWARAVEVTLIGLVLGAAFLRYGILTTVAAHFTLNAFVTAVPMLASGTPWLALQGGIALLIAFLPAVVAVGLLAYGRTAGGQR